MKKRFIALLMATAMLAGCSSTSGDTTTTGSASSSSESTAAGSGEAATEETAEVYGDRDLTNYRQLYSSEFTTLDYYATSNNNELKVLANAVDSLVDYDEYGNKLPGLALSWEPNDDYTVWTFHLREGVMWYDFEGNEIAETTANDWVSALEYVNSASSNSSMQYLCSFIKNADAYYEQTAAEFNVAQGTYATVEEYYEAEGMEVPSTTISFDEVGVKAVDDYTLEFTLEEPCTFFVSVTSFAPYMPVYGPFLEQMGVNFGADNSCILYNGAYIITEYEPQVRRVLTVNENYWDKENVYITTITYTYNANDTTLAPSMFLSGEVDEAIIPSDILDEWMTNEDSYNAIHPDTTNLDYSYFYAFNFEARFDEAYEPDNWTLAVNNENFRKSIQSGLDRLRALAVYDPYNPDTALSNTITPETFVDYEGKDYTEFGGLNAFTGGDSFDEAAAIEYRDAAIEELTAAGASFPVKVLMMYNPSITNWDKEAQVVEQQLENLLGTDYIDIIVEAGPETAFLSEVRRSGKYALMLCNWGADYADPSTYADPFAEGNSYNFMYTADKQLGDIPRNNKTADTQALTEEYYALIAQAKAATEDNERYEYYAQAESFLIEHAFVIPMRVSYDGYIASMLNPFDREYATFGVSRFRFKGRKLLEQPLNTEEYQAAYVQWQTERAEAIAE